MQLPLLREAEIDVTRDPTTHVHLEGLWKAATELRRVKVTGLPTVFFVSPAKEYDDERTMDELVVVNPKLRLSDLKSSVRPNP